MSSYLYCRQHVDGLSETYSTKLPASLKSQLERTENYLMFTEEYWDNFSPMDDSVDLKQSITSTNLKCIVAGCEKVLIDVNRSAYMVYYLVCARCHTSILAGHIYQKQIVYYPGGPVKPGLLNEEKNC